LQEEEVKWQKLTEQFLAKERDWEKKIEERELRKEKENRKRRLAQLDASLEWAGKIDYYPFPLPEALAKAEEMRSFIKSLPSFLRVCGTSRGVFSLNYSYFL
jgi:LPS O-antigen subunit length determinant protein (WzzB/FepE family)